MDAADSGLGELERERVASMRVRFAGVALVSAAIWFSHWLWYEADIFPVRLHSRVYRSGELLICTALVALALSVRSLRKLEWTGTALLCALTLLHGFALLVVADSCFVPFLLTLEWGNVVIALAAALAFRPSVTFFVTTWAVGVAATRLRAGYDADLSDHLVLALIYFTVSISIRNYDRSRLAAHHARHELGQANLALQRSEQARSRLFENLSHDFRTPLALIDGDAQRIALSADDAETEHAVRRMRANTRAMADLTDQLLQVAQLDAKAQSPEPEALGLGRLVGEVVAQFDGGQNQGRIRISGAEDIAAHADPRHVRRIVHNLLANAVRQLERAATEIRVELAEHEGVVSVDVINDGPTIPAERRELIFRRFASFDASGSVASGIGLPLARELAQLNQGKLELLPLTDVTAFRLTLPRAEALPASTADPRAAEVTASLPEATSMPSSRRQSAGRRLLVVEDNAQMRELLLSMLRDHFYVTTATSLRDGLEKAASSAPNVLLVDMMLPDGTGLELLEQLPRIVEGVTPPLVFLSAASDEQLRVEALSKGASDFVLKPFGAEELRARLEAACRTADELEGSLKRQRDEFAAELHDGVNSALARAAMLLEAAQRRQRSELVPMAREAVITALDQARSLLVLQSRQSVPLGAATSELEAAVRSALAGFDVECELKTSSDGTLPALTGVEHHTLGRLAVEASTNALKHGAPRQIECSLTVTAGQVELRVTSDSSTSSAAELADLGSGKGLTLAGVRLDRLGGWIRSEPSARGTWTLSAGFAGALATRRSSTETLMGQAASAV